ncbi:hypothetical protein SAMN06265371_101513 [Lutibacter agarilyticus]|uniref:Uncharacterized protein n=1 Tax=Lutibacter agarilyticus TaxID=1109740 RepID=A0A238VIU7_9FLAO|nr:hypothetical protein [Lutibacter agarilyticus]SNR34320.1 hypothetical protein SAMN06265371_101513 [Lutibacter agarilyticus]
MMKLYTEKTSCEEQPRKEIIQYLLNYSKQLRVVKTNQNCTIELHLN